MGPATEPRSTPDLRTDAICQRQIAALFGVFERTASLQAKAGRLRRFEHGVPNCGRRKYSRRLVELEVERRWRQAVQGAYEE
ncbi:hypothetical protein [Paludisphaera soli]|uniref:hypothetical protein n=1 Tax=Paludisphaera soli TaxID=2712865 RepID=UPI0013E9ED71|nr:hypothetical protein [Paludisphaera soli]